MVQPFIIGQGHLALVTNFDTFDRPAHATTQQTHVPLTTSQAHWHLVHSAGHCSHSTICSGFLSPSKFSGETHPHLACVYLQARATAAAGSAGTGFS